MEIIPAAGEAENLETELLVLGVFSDGPLTGSVRAVNDRSTGRLAALLRRDGLGETVGAARLIGPLPGVAARRILLIGLGRAEAFSDRAYRRALAATAGVLNEDPAHEAVVTLAENEVARRPLAWRVQQAGRSLVDGRYDFRLPKTSAPGGVRSIMLLLPRSLTSELVEALRQGVAIGEGVSFARDLGNLPPDICTPSFMVQAARTMAREFGLRMEVLGPREFEKHGMTAFLKVEKAAAESCKLIVLKCDRRKDKGPPIVLVGNGVTDGGPHRFQEQHLRRDPTRNMRGAGSVLGAVRTVVRLGLALNVVGLIVASEEAHPRGAEAPAGWHEEAPEPESSAVQEPSLLTDVLGYAAHFSPSCVIDIATLTRACVVALGSQASGLFTNDEALAEELLKCGGTSGDRVWQLPIWDEDRAPAADRRNEADQAADNPATAIAAASNLARFATAYPWAHLDISGTTSTVGRAGTSTGPPVPLLAEFLIGRARVGPGRLLSPTRPRTELH